ncbi:MAG: SRPBCC family protein [Burkholderiales bacterium]
MFKNIAIVIVVLIAGVLVFAATRPDAFRVERSVSIKAPPEKIYPYFDDFNRWSVWSPWEKLDPSMKRTFSGAASGKGAAYAWEGNSKVGTGHMEIIDSTPSSKLLIKLDFLKPFEGHNTAEYTLVPTGDGTQVTWAMYGPAPYISKLMGVFVSMDSMIGKDFEAGLANLKAVAEK